MDEREKKVQSSRNAGSIEGKVISDLLAHFTHDMSIGKMVQTGELRKRVPEPVWIAPPGFNMTHLDMDGFSMKMLSPSSNPSEDYVVLQLHGGGYIGAVRNKYYTFARLYSMLGDNLCVLTPDYRVAPENPYPAALEDAVASYKWLLSHGFSGERIILAGDSAGGGLCTALAMYLRDHDIEMPRAIIAMSPWMDLTAAGESYILNYEKDPLFGNTKESMIYLNPYPGEEDPCNPYISPLFGNMEGLPPMLIQVGSDEMLLSDSVDFAEKAKRAGVDVKLTVYEGMFHVFQMCYMRIPESRNAWNEVKEFIGQLPRTQH